MPPSSMDQVQAAVNRRLAKALRTTPTVVLGIADRVWTIGDLLDATLALEPNRPIRTVRKFTVIDGGKS